MIVLVFSSIIFLFVYLPAVLALYYITPKKARNYLLFAVNLIFYGWGEPKLCVLMVVSIFVNYISGLLIGKARKGSAKNNAKSKAVMIVSVAINLGLLGYFKYAGFIGSILHLPVGDIPLPIGISFYTFQSMSYTIDVYRSDAEPQKNFFTFGTYVSLFPQLIAGPIVRYQTIETELSTRRFNADDIKEGTYRFISGLAKKVLIADNVARLSDAIYKVYAESGMYNPTAYDSVGTTALWLASFAYTMQIFFDFSGYSDMAIGLGRIFGFHFPLVVER